jgi:hypothetical protein
MKRVCSALAAVAALSACASIETTVAPPEALQAFEAGQSSVLVINASGDIYCDEVIMGLYREGADHSEVVWTLRDVGYETSQPALIVVEPGRYALSGASCFKAGYVPADMPNVDLWFDYVTAGAGEAVYLGTLDADLTEAQSRTPESAFAAFFADPTNTYLTYEFQDRSDEVLERLRVSHPALAEKLVVRTPPQVITREEFVAAIETAFAAGADGVLPTREEAQDRLAEEIVAIADRAVARLEAQAAGEPSASSAGGDAGAAAGEEGPASD